MRRYARALDGVTGDRIFDRTTGTWKTMLPEAAIAIDALRTPLGTAAHDRTKGIDLTGIDLGAANAPAIGRQRILKALERHTRDGTFSVKTLVVEVQGDAMVYELMIRTPRGEEDTFSDRIGTT